MGLNKYIKDNPFILLFNHHIIVTHLVMIYMFTINAAAIFCSASIGFLYTY